MSFLVFLLSAGCQIRCESVNQIPLTIRVSHHDESLSRLRFTVAYNFGLTAVLNFYIIAT